MSFATRLLIAGRRHWPHYLAEGLGLAWFVLCAGLLTMLLEHPESGVRQALPDNEWLRRGLLGVAMGLVLASIVYSPWGKRSGAHINPAVTVAFWQLGSMRLPDVLGYVLAQTAGAVAAAQVLRLTFGRFYAHPAVKHTVTEPSALPWADAVAFAAEFSISFVLMGVLLYALHSRALKQRAGWLLAALLAIYIFFETPLSGMSLNPARTLGTAVAAGSYRGLWIYWVAPPAAMWLATVLFRRFYRNEKLACAVLAGCAPPPASPLAPEEEAPPQYPDAS